MSQVDLETVENAYCVAGIAIDQVNKKSLLARMSYKDGCVFLITIGAYTYSTRDPQAALNLYNNPPKEVYEPQPQRPDSPAVIAELLNEVGYSCAIETIEMWTPEQQLEANLWASALCLQRRGNLYEEIPHRPDWL